MAKDIDYSPAFEIASKWLEEMNDTRIKCPTCKSPQVELVWEDRSSYSTQKTKRYICQCGCCFDAIFCLVERKIITEEG